MKRLKIPFSDQFFFQTIELYVLEMKIFEEKQKKYLINPIDIQINCAEEKWSRFLNVNGINEFRNISMQKTQHKQCMNSFAFIMHDKYA